MCTKHLCVFIHFRTMGELKTFKHSGYLFFADHSFVDPFCYLCSMFVFVMLSCLFLAAL